MIKHGLGAIFSDIDVRDYKGVCCVSDANIPEDYELSLVRVKNQGSVGSCVAHALSSVVEYFNFVQHNTNEEMSVGYIYGNRENSTHKKEGMILRHALANMCKYGDVRKKDFPYNWEVPEIIEKFQEVKDDLYEIGYVSRFSSYCRLNNEKDIKASLMSKNPVVFAMKWYKDIKVVDGIITTTEKESSSGHCMIIYGWNSKGWKIQNSWGKDWGVKGTAILPYNIKIREAWAITDNITDTLEIKKPFASTIGQIIAKIINIILNYIKKDK